MESINDVDMDSILSLLGESTSNSIIMKKPSQSTGKTNRIGTSEKSENDIFSADFNVGKDLTKKNTKVMGTMKNEAGRITGPSPLLQVDEKSSNFDIDEILNIDSGSYLPHNDQNEEGTDVNCDSSTALLKSTVEKKDHILEFENLPTKHYVPHLEQDSIVSHNFQQEVKKNVRNTQLLNIDQKKIDKTTENVTTRIDESSHQLRHEANNTISQQDMMPPNENENQNNGVNYEKIEECPSRQIKENETLIDQLENRVEEILKKKVNLCQYVTKEKDDIMIGNIQLGQLTNRIDELEKNVLRRNNNLLEEGIDRFVKQIEMFVNSKLDESESSIKKKLLVHEQKLIQTVETALSNYAERIISKQNENVEIIMKDITGNTNKMNCQSNALKEIQMSYNETKDILNKVSHVDFGAHQEIILHIQKLYSKVEKDENVQHKQLQSFMSNLEFMMQEQNKHTEAEKERLIKEYSRLIDLQLKIESDRREMIMVQDEERAKLAEKVMRLNTEIKQKDEKFATKMQELESSKITLEIKEKELCAKQKEFEKQRINQNIQHQKEKNEMKLIDEKQKNDAKLLEDLGNRIKDKIAESKKYEQYLCVKETKMDAKQYSLRKMADDLSLYSNALKLKEENAHNAFHQATKKKLDADEVKTETRKERQILEEEKIVLSNYSAELKRIKLAIVRQRILSLSERSNDYLSRNKNPVSFNSCNMLGSTS